MGLGFFISPKIKNSLKKADNFLILFKPQIKLNISTQWKISLL